MCGFEDGDHAVQVERLERDPQPHPRGLGHVAVPVEVRVHRPADLARRVLDALDREEDVADHAPVVLDGDLPVVAVAREGGRRGVLGDLLGHDRAVARFEEQVAADVVAGLVRVDVVDVVGGHHPQEQPLRAHGLERERQTGRHRPHHRASPRQRCRSARKPPGIRSIACRRGCGTKVPTGLRSAYRASRRSSSDRAGPRPPTRARRPAPDPHGGCPPPGREVSSISPARSVPDAQRHEPHRP